MTLLELMEERGRFRCDYEPTKVGLIYGVPLEALEKDELLMAIPIIQAKANVDNRRKAEQWAKENDTIIPE